MRELVLKSSKKYEKDLVKLKKQGKDMRLLNDILERYLIKGLPLPPEYRDHKLNNSKQFKNCRECHIGGIKSDWLLVYRIDSNTLILECIRTGSHSEIFSDKTRPVSAVYVSKRILGHSSSLSEE